MTSLSNERRKAGCKKRKFTVLRYGDALEAKVQPIPDTLIDLWNLRKAKRLVFKLFMKLSICTASHHAMGMLYSADTVNLFNNQVCVICSAWRVCVCVCVYRLYDEHP